MEVLLELMLHSVMAFFGALAGVLYPPKSAAWARWQHVGIALGISGVLVLAAGIVAAPVAGWYAFTSVSIVVAAGLLIAYLIVGNICRKFHEGETHG
jgi:hypothetical protein